jgi:hypothetical protein
MDGDLSHWTESFLSESMVEITIEGYVKESQSVDVGVPHRSPVSLILFAIYTSGLIMWGEEYESELEGLSFVDDLDGVETGSDIHYVLLILERCAAMSIQRAS